MAQTAPGAHFHREILGKLVVFVTKAKPLRRPTLGPSRHYCWLIAKTESQIVSHPDPKSVHPYLLAPPCPSCSTPASHFDPGTNLTICNSTLLAAHRHQSFPHARLLTFTSAHPPLTRPRLTELSHSHDTMSWWRLRQSLSRHSSCMIRCCGHSLTELDIRRRGFGGRGRKVWWWWRWRREE
jgi:hypothetical protein